MEFFRQKYWSGLTFPFSRGSSQFRDWTWVSCIAGRFFTIWAAREALDARSLMNNWSLSFSSVQFSCSVVSNSLLPHESQHARPPCPSPTPGVHWDVHWVSDAIQPSHPLSSPSPPAPNPSQHQSLFQWVNSSHEVAKINNLMGKHFWFKFNFKLKNTWV